MNITKLKDLCYNSDNWRDPVPEEDVLMSVNYEICMAWKESDSPDWKYIEGSNPATIKAPPEAVHIARAIIKLLDFAGAHKLDMMPIQVVYEQSEVQGDSHGTLVCSLTANFRYKDKSLNVDNPLIRLMAYARDRGWPIEDIIKAVLNERQTEE